MNKLDLSNGKYTEGFLKNIEDKGLIHHLDISCNKLGKYFPSDDLKLFRNLRSLNISYNDIPSDVLEMVILNLPATVIYFDISGNYVNKVICEVLPTLVLNTLKVNNVDKSNYEVLLKAFTGEHIKNLEINGCVLNSNETLKVFIIKTKLLTRLSIQNAEIDNIDEILPVCVNLREVYLKDSGVVSQDILKKFLKISCVIQKLSINVDNTDGICDTIMYHNKSLLEISLVTDYDDTDFIVKLHDSLSYNRIKQRNFVLNVFKDMVYNTCDVQLSCETISKALNHTIYTPSGSVPRNRYEYTKKNLMDYYDKVIKNKIKF